MDNAATAPIEPDVYEATLPFLFEKFGNPSGLYPLGVEARRAIDDARHYVADLIGTKADRIFFTSGATESNNWVLKTVAAEMKNMGRGNHIITTQIEHKSVLNTCHYLERNGFRVTYLPVNKKGLISITDLIDSIDEETILVSVMFANNEIGTIEPICSIGNICQRYNIPFHCDATQALGKTIINVESIDIDFLTASAHKIGGLKGCGMVYCNLPKYKDYLKTYIHGGLQERGFRSGTENVVGIVAFGEAARLANEDKCNRNAIVRFLRNYLLDNLLQIEGAELNGPSLEHRLLNNINIRFKGVSGTALQGLLAEKGICVSVGSACNNGDATASHVLKAIGLTDEESRESIRITLSHHNTVDECCEVADSIKHFVKLLREAC